MPPSANLHCRALALRQLKLWDHCLKTLVEPDLDRREAHELFMKTAAEMLTVEEKGNKLYSHYSKHCADTIHSPGVRNVRNDTTRPAHVICHC